MTTTPDPHEPYITAVVAALGAAGITTTHVVDETTATIDIGYRHTRRAYGRDHVALTWSGEEGWLLLWGHNYRAGYDYGTPLCDTLVPEPLSVFQALRSALASPPDPADSARTFRRAGEDVPALLANLAAYTEEA